MTGMNKTIRLADVAAHAGVSKSAASKALLGGGGKTTKVSEKTAERIRAAARELGYQPNSIARQLKTRQSKIVGAIIHSSAPMLFYNLFSYIENELSQMGYCFMVGQSNGDISQIKRYLSEFQARGIDVVISELFESEQNQKELTKLYSKYNNILYLGRPILDNVPYVALDIKGGVIKLIDYLISKKCINIIIDLPCLFFSSVQERKAGYIEGLRKNNIAFKQELCLETYHDNSKLDQAISLLADQTLHLKADAVIAGNDIRAIKLIKELKNRKIRVPADISVTGFDNLEIAELYEPGITSVDLDNEMIASSCIKLTKKIINNVNSIGNITVQSKLIPRESA